MTPRIQTSPVPQIGQVYVCIFDNLRTFQAKKVESYSEPGTFIEMLQATPKPRVGDQVLFLEKCFEKDLISTTSDHLLFKFLLLKDQTVFYLRMAPVSNHKDQDALEARANHSFFWYFNTIERYYKKSKVLKQQG